MLLIDFSPNRINADTARRKAKIEEGLDGYEGYEARSRSDT